MITFAARFALPSTLLLAAVAAHGQQGLVQALSEQQLIATGRGVYVQNCAGCHGASADGNGPAAPMLNPKPRNLLTGAFKFRSTPTGSLPQLQDLIRTIDQGVLGTSMPSFRLMSAQEKLAVAKYIMSLRPEWSKEQGQSIAFPAPPTGLFQSKKLLLASAQRGHKLYVETCQICHGDKGRGDGPGASALVDGEERPIVPANLQRSFVKGGRGAMDVFKAISTGLDGTPMPGFGEVFSVEQRWDLVAFVFYLRGIGAGIYQETDLEKGSGK